MTCTDCPMMRAKTDRIADLEERLAYYERAFSSEKYTAPVEWALTCQQEILARLLASRDGVTTNQFLMALDGQAGVSFADRLGAGEQRCVSLARTLACRLRVKLADFGWLLPKLTLHGSPYHIIPEQRADFKAAMRGDGPIAFPAMTKRSAA